jgi:putative ABC transport system ATP-binding protein
MNISLLNTSREYELDNKNKITPVNNVNLVINDGEFILIVGRSGSGKTTLLNLIAGLIRPTNGKVLINDIDPWTLNDKKLSVFRSQTMGYVFQYPSLIPSLTVIENVKLPTTFTGRDGHASANDRAVHLLEMLGIGNKLNMLPKQLSAGEQRRVVIARALVNRPRVLLADEPTSDLDMQTEKEIMSLFQEIHAEGVTIIMVTHSLELISYATMALKMEQGIVSLIRTKQS